MLIPPSLRLSGIGEYYFSSKLAEIRKMNESGQQVISLGIGSPDLPPPAAVIEELQRVASQPSVHGYQPYTGIPALRKAAAEFYSRHFHVRLDPSREILPVMGSKEAILQVSLAFLNPGDEVLVPDPGYPTYRSLTMMSGALLRTYDLVEKNRWLPDLSELERQDLSKVRLMWVNYPHMPTGTMADEDIFRRLIRFAREHSILLCHDNPYAFILNKMPLSVLSLPGAMDVAIELSSLSKSFNMAGWRIGFIAGQEEVLKKVLVVSSNYQSGMFYAMQMAAVKALESDASWFAELNRHYRNRSLIASSLLTTLGCTLAGEQSGLFLWARIPPAFNDDYAFSDTILDRCRVFLTPGSVFGKNGKGYIRLSLCQPENILEEAKQRIVDNFIQ